MLLRSGEVAKLHLRDVDTQLPRPYLRVLAGAAKGNRPRVVPLWWDAGRPDGLEGRAGRVGARPDEPFVASQRPGRVGTALSRHTLRKRFHTGL